jgi:hypothetical protein
MKSTVFTPIALGNDTRSGQTRLSDRVWFNAAWFQVTWLCLVLGRENLLPFSAALIILHLVMVRDLWAELLRLSSIASIGISIDALLSVTGFFQFTGDAIIPLWLIGLWLVFATTLTRSLAWLARYPALVVGAGALVLPLNYWVGMRLGAVEFPQSLILTLATMSVLWMVTLPMMYRVCAALVRAEQGETMQ